MIGQRFEQVNCMFGKPEGWTDEQCHAVHGYSGPADTQTCKGEQVIITAWKPTPEELVRLNLGEPLWLIISGARMVPVILTTDNPWEGK